MREIQIGQMQFMDDRLYTRQRHVQATNAAQEATRAAGGHSAALDERNVNYRKCEHPGSVARSPKFGREGHRAETCF